jgi:hypothetical protein
MHPITLSVVLAVSFLPALVLCAGFTAQVQMVLKLP